MTRTKISDVFLGSLLQFSVMAGPLVGLFSVVSSPNILQCALVLLCSVFLVNACQHAALNWMADRKEAQDPGPKTPDPFQ